eukprot:s3179_g3.t1
MRMGAAQTRPECVLPDGSGVFPVENQSMVGTAVGPPAGGSNPTTTSISFFLNWPACCMGSIGGSFRPSLSFFVQQDQSDENFELSLETPFGFVPSTDVILGGISDFRFRRVSRQRDSNPATFIYTAVVRTPLFSGQAAGGTVVAHFITSVAGLITDAGSPLSPFAPRLNVFLQVCPATTTSAMSTTSTTTRIVCAGTKLVEIPGGDIQVGPGPNGFQLASVVDARGTDLFERVETPIPFEIDIPCSSDLWVMGKVPFRENLLTLLFRGKPHGLSGSQV